jgi:periplasmic copper chaperone A
MIRRVLALVAGALAAVLMAAAPVLAHIDPDPKEAQAGSVVTVGFTVEHGCGGSPTVQLDMRLPDGVVDARPEPLDGWEESIDGDVVTFTGGPLPDDVEGTFAVTMTLPPTPDTTIYFPFVQRCEAGEIRWIAIPTEPGDEPDEPAPAMRLFGPVVPPPPPAPDTTAAPDSTATATTTPDTTTSPETTIEAAPTTEPVVVAPGTDGRGDSNVGTIAFILTMLAVFALGLLVWWRARAARRAAPPTVPSST